MAISTDAKFNTLPLSAIMAASMCMLNSYNSKSRIMPWHLFSAPGVGKSMVIKEIARQQAHATPGVPYGFGIANPGNMSPAEVAGYTLFGDYVHPPGSHRAGQTEKVSYYTRPAVFSLSCVFIASPADPNDVRAIKRDILGQTLFPECIVLCPFTGKHLEVLDGLILLDEYMQADPEVRKVLAPLKDEGRITNHTLPPGFAVWCASNRAVDQSGTGKALAFDTNREGRIEVSADIKALLRFGQGHRGMDSMEVNFLPLTQAPADPDSPRPWHPALLAFAENTSDVIFGGVPADPSVPFLTARSLEATANLFDVMMVHPAQGSPDSEDYIESSVVESGADPFRHHVFRSLASGLIGSANASTFLGTLALFGETPSVAEMAASPTTCHVSEKKDARIVSAYKISNGMTLRNGNALFKYAKRMDPSGVLLGNIVINAAQRSPELLQVDSMLKYFSDNPSAFGAMTVARANAAKAQAGKGKR